MDSTLSKPSTTAGYQEIRNASNGQRLLFLFKDSMLYGGAWALSKVLALFTIPILTRLFSTEAYGALDAIATLGALFVSFITMGQDSAIARFYYETEDPGERKEIISQSLLIQGALCGVVSVTLWFAADWVVRNMIVVPEHAGPLRVLVMSYPFVILFQFYQHLAKWTFGRRQFIFLSVGSGMAVLALTLVLVWGLGLGVVGVFYAQLIGMGIFALVGLFMYKDFWVWPTQMNYGWKLLSFGWPYMLVAILAMMIPALDRFFITHFLNMEAMGYYAAGFKMAVLIGLPITAFQTAWGPFMLALYKEPNALETYNKVLLYYTAAISFLGFCLVAMIEPLMMVLTSSRYLQGSVVVLPIAFSLIVESIAWIMGIGIDLSKKTYGSTLSYGVGMIISAGLIWVLIEPYGIWGVAYGVFLGRVAQGLSYIVFAYRVYPLRFAWKKPLVLFLMTLVSALLFQLIPPSEPIYHALFRIFLLIALGVVFWHCAISTEERNWLFVKLKSQA
jgi:O-antigen/teichoic acid export membrane protein